MTLLFPLLVWSERDRPPTSCTPRSVMVTRSSMTITVFSAKMESERGERTFRKAKRVTNIYCCLGMFFGGGGVKLHKASLAVCSTQTVTKQGVGDSPCPNGELLQLDNRSGRKPSSFGIPQHFPGLFCPRRSPQLSFRTWTVVIPCSRPIRMRPSCNLATLGSSTFMKSATRSVMSNCHSEPSR